MVLESVRPPNVPDDGSRVAVPALVHDPCEIRAAFGCRRDVPSPQAMRPEGRRIESGSRGVTLEHVRDGLRCEASPAGPHPPST